MTSSPSEPSTPRRRLSPLRIATALAGIAAILPLSGCFDAQAGITISGDDRVSVLSFETGREVARIKVGDHPQRMRTGVIRARYLD